MASKQVALLGGERGFREEGGGQGEVASCSLDCEQDYHPPIIFIIVNTVVPYQGWLRERRE